MNIKKMATVGTDESNIEVWFIVKFINNDFKIYNTSDNSWYALDSGNGTIFKDKDKALKFVEKLYSEDKKNPIFLSGGRGVE